jgi:hypothetical protein
MTTTELIVSIISALCLVITAILAWVSIYRTNHVSVSFSGTPVDVKECQRQTAEHKKADDLRAQEIIRLAAKVAAEREADAMGAKKDRGDLYNHIDGVRKELKVDIEKYNDNTQAAFQSIRGDIGELRGVLRPDHERKH